MVCRRSSISLSRPVTSRSRRHLPTPTLLPSLLCAQLLLQLPRVESFEQDIAEGDPNAASATVAEDDPAKWGDALEQLVSVRMGGGSTADVGGWRARAKMREDLLAQHEEQAVLSQDAEDNLRRVEYVIGRL